MAKNNNTLLFGGLLLGVWLLNKNGAGKRGATGAQGGTGFLETLFVGDNTLVSTEDVLLADEDIGLASKEVPLTSSQGVTTDAPTAGGQVLETAQADKAIKDTLQGGDFSFIAATPEFQRTIDAIGSLTGSRNVQVDTTALFSALQHDAQIGESIVVAVPGLSPNDRAIAFAAAARERIASFAGDSDDGDDFNFDLDISHGDFEFE